MIFTLALISCAGTNYIHSLSEKNSSDSNVKRVEIKKVENKIVKIKKEESEIVKVKKVSKISQNIQVR